MTNCIAAVFAGAAVQSWTPTADVTLVGASQRGDISTVISEDPTFTADQMVNTQQVVDRLIYAGSSNGTAPLAYTPLSFQLGKGQPIYFSANGAGAIFLFYAPAESIAT